MRIIREADPIISQICGPQIKTEADYRWTKHMLIVTCDEGKLLYNTFTGELLLLEAGDDEKLCRDELIRKRYLVPKDFLENRYEDEMRKIAGLFSTKPANITKFTVLTTTDCNARCYYCYEKGIPRIRMNEKTAVDVGKYISRASGGNKVKLSWFGGEPLYNLPAIDIICGYLRCQDIPYYSNMVSNAYFLEPLVIEKAVNDWMLENIEITIDGTREVYKRTKAFVNAVDDPLERVMKNIDNALDAGIEIVVRLNMDADNADDLLRLCDIMKDRWGGKSGLSVVAVLLRTFAGKIRSFKTEEIAVERYFQLYDKLEKSDLLLKQEYLEHQLYGNRCMADSDSSEVILPDGRIAKCEHFDENEVVGSIYDPTRNEEILRSWKEYGEDYEECKTCEFYPRCKRLTKCPWHMGGCELSKRLIAKRRLERQILRAYEESKKGKE